MATGHRPGALRQVFWFLLAGALWLAATRFIEVTHVTRALAAGQWPWLAAAVATQALYYPLYAWLYQSAFEAVGVRSRVRELLPVVLGSLFANAAAPSAGVLGAALFVDDAVRRGESGTRAAAGTLLALTADLAALAVALAVGFGVLLNDHDVRPYEIAGTVILLGVLAVLSGTLVACSWRPDWIRRAATLVERLWRRVLTGVCHVRPLAAGWGEAVTSRLSEAASVWRAHPRVLARTALIAAGAHAVDLATLSLVALAFHAPSGPGRLVAAYGVGMLFWIVSPTPQGIGVVEGAMALVFASQGLSPAQAAVIAVTFRGLTFWLPLLAGAIVARRLPSFRTERRPPRGWGVRLVALLTALMGLVNVASAVAPALGSRLLVVERYVPIQTRHDARVASVLAGFGLLGLARSLWRRKEVAWWLATTLLIVSAGAHLVKGLDYEVAAAAIGLAVWLGMLRGEFRARSDPPSVAHGLRALAGAIILTLSYGAAGFYFLDRHFRVRYSLADALRQTVVMFAGLPPSGVHPLTRYGRYFVDSIYTVAGVTLVYVLAMLMRPVVLRRPVTATDRRRAQGIVQAHGRSSLAQLTLLPDKSYFFSPHGSVVAYTIAGRVALALGDPIGPGTDLPAAISAFRAYCERNDWIPAFYQTLPESRQAYEAAGMRALRIGHEGIVDLAGFTLQGRANKELRGAVNRLTRLGHRTVLHEPPLPDGVLDDLRVISDEWLAAGTREKRFSLGWFDPDYIRASPVMAVRTPGGRITAFANIISEYQRNECTIDLMRRRPDAPPGTMDFLFAALLEWARGRSFATFNLGLSPLAGVGDQAGAPAVERALHAIYEHLNQFYHFRGLYDFKRKFHPQWSPRYLIYPGPADLPAVALAIVEADAGAGPWRLSLWTVREQAARVRRRHRFEVSTNGDPA